VIDEGALHTERFPVGISSSGLTEVDRLIPAGEPPPLAPNADLKVVGQRTPRIDALAKVTGAACFTVDVKLPGMLHAGLLRASMPHARIRAIDVSAAARFPGVRAVEVIADPGNPSTA